MYCINLVHKRLAFYCVICVCMFASSSVTVFYECIVSCLESARVFDAEVTVVHECIL